MLYEALVTATYFEQDGVYGYHTLDAFGWTDKAGLEGGQPQVGCAYIGFLTFEQKTALETLIASDATLSGVVVEMASDK